MTKIRTPVHRDKHKIGAIMRRVYNHAVGEDQAGKPMTPTELKAAELFLRKALPDLARTELANKEGEELRIILQHAIASPPNADN